MTFPRWGPPSEFYLLRLCNASVSRALWFAGWARRQQRHTKATCAMQSVWESTHRRWGHRCSESFAGSRTFKWRGKHHAILPSFTLAAPLRRKKSDKFPQTHAYRTALNRLGSNESFLGNGQVGSVVTTAGIPCAGSGINIWPSFFQWDNFSPGLNL